jgi:hypothetical protein
MKEVSKEVFEKTVLKLDVCYTPMGDHYPYWDKYTFRNGDIAGTKRLGEGYMISDKLYEKYCR